MALGQLITTVTCDRCKTTTTDIPINLCGGLDKTAWTGQVYRKLLMVGWGWEIKSKRQYCPDCWERGSNECILCR